MIGQTDEALLAPTVDIWSPVQQFNALTPQCRDCNRSMKPKSFNGVKLFDVNRTRLVHDRYYPRELLPACYYCPTTTCFRTMSTTSPHYLLTLPEEILLRCPAELRHRSAVTPRLRDEITTHLSKGISVKQYVKNIAECEEQEWNRRTFTIVDNNLEFCSGSNHRHLFPKGECLSTHRVGPLGLNGFLYLGLLFVIFHPYEP